MATKAEIGERSWIKWLGWLIFLLVIGSWWLNPKVTQSWYGQPDGVGTFGDSYGALTSLFTGLAFAGLIVTLLQQREDLRLQRAEAKRMVDELGDQKQQMELQNASIRQQTFFNMLQVFNDYIASMENGDNEDNATGRNLNEIVSRPEYDFLSYVPQKWFGEDTKVIQNEILRLEMPDTT